MSTWTKLEHNELSSTPDRVYESNGAKMMCQNCNLTIKFIYLFF